MEVKDVEGFNRAAELIKRSLAEQDHAGAIETAEKCTGDEALVTQILAYTYTEAGRDIDDCELLEKGVACWKALIEATGGSADLKFNLANAEEGIVEAVGRSRDYLTSFIDERDRLQRARELFAQAGEDESATEDLRVLSWTNRGNAFDYFSRSFEALDSYAKAIEIDGEFGMALGNRGTTLLRFAPLIRDHQPMILLQAADALDVALADGERVIATGGPSALEHFREARDRIPELGELPALGKVKWTDPYLFWCSWKRLFLHVSPECLTREDAIVDPLFFTSLRSGISDKAQARMTILIDAFDALKQDYLSTRYLAWLATDSDSPIKKHASEISKQGIFWDSLNYARWGVTTGLAGQALAAAVNVLDKVASFVHLYLDTSRKPTGVYFTTLWHNRGKTVMDAEIKAEIEQGNRGLFALCDLSSDHEQRTPLKEFSDHRHAATHRFLVTHDMGLIEKRTPTGEWLERLEWQELVDWIEISLRTARAALVYLAWMIDLREARGTAASEAAGEMVPTLPMQHAMTEHPDF